MLQQDNEVIPSLLTKWSASATRDQSTVLVLVTIYHCNLCFRPGSEMAALTPKELVSLLNIIEEVLYFFQGILIGQEAALTDILVVSKLMSSLHVCRILLRRTLWRISAAGCTSPLPSRIISR